MRRSGAEAMDTDTDGGRRGGRAVSSGGLAGRLLIRVLVHGRSVETSRNRRLLAQQFDLVNGLCGVGASTFSLGFADAQAAHLITNIILDFSVPLSLSAAEAR
jgi:hypothetical protein